MRVCFLLGCAAGFSFALSACGAFEGHGCDQTGAPTLFVDFEEFGLVTTAQPTKRSGVWINGTCSFNTLQEPTLSDATNFRIEPIQPAEPTFPMLVDIRGQSVFNFDLVFSPLTVGMHETTLTVPFGEGVDADPSDSLVVTFRGVAEK